jgi:hypothetical protein
MLDLCDLIHMLQANGAHGSLRGISHRWTAGTSLALLTIVVVHGAWHIASASNLVLCGEYTSSAEQEGCCGRRAQGKVK